MRNLKATLGLFWGFFLLSAIPVFAGGSGASCSIYDAVYKPHPSYAEKKLNFTMKVKRPETLEKGGSHRSIFFYIDAFETKSDKKVSTMRLSDSCSNGSSRCFLTSYEGQYNANDEMRVLESGLSFEPIALDSAFAEVNYYGPKAPHAIILSNTAQIYYKRNHPSFKKDASQYVHFYTDDKIFPDFSGYDVWILKQCDTDADYL